MRKAYKVVRFSKGMTPRTGVDRSSQEFAETMGYGQVAYTTPEEFLARYEVPANLELRNALKQVLSKERRVFSIGSGECEHEIPLFLEGYNISGSDVAPSALSPIQKLFPKFSAVVFDIMNPPSHERFDDILITGLDFYFPKEAFALILQNVKSLLRPNGRLLFVLRYKDNWVTRLIDYVGIPMICAASNMRQWFRQGSFRYTLKFHGYRRTSSEIITMARQAGFQSKRILYAGFGMELNRLYLQRFPTLFAWLRRLDSQLHILNTATVFEFTT